MQPEHKTTPSGPRAEVWSMASQIVGDALLDRALPLDARRVLAAVQWRLWEAARVDMGLPTTGLAQARSQGPRNSYDGPESCRQNGR